MVAECFCVFVCVFSSYKNKRAGAVMASVTQAVQKGR